MKRIALVVGNGTYEHASALSAPRGDALAMRNLLTRLGFDCVDGYDCNFQQFREKRRDFLDIILFRLTRESPIRKTSAG